MKLSVLVRLVCSSLTGLLLLPGTTQAQTIDEDQLGAWYFYAFNYNRSGSRWGAQGDIQYRNWDTIGDLEQLLIRSGITYRPESLPGKYTLGYANITSGTFGSSSRTLREDRVYQEALFPHRLGERVYVRHRLRYSSGGLNIRIFERAFATACLSIFLSIKPLSIRTRGIYPFTTRSSSTGNTTLGWISGSTPMTAIDFMLRLGTACRITQSFSLV